MIRRLFYCLVAVAMLTSCSIEAGNEKKQVTQAVSQNIQNNNTSQNIWDLYVEQNGNAVEDLLGIPQEPDLFPLYMEGVKHKSPLVRWYAVNKCLEFASEKNKDVLIEELGKLQNDPDEKVKSAASFVRSAVDKSFEGERFTKTKDGKRVAFYRYHEAAYNDGNVWVSTDEIIGSWCTYNVGGSVNKLAWSPDGNKLCIECGGRTWHFVSFVDLSNGQVKEVGLFSKILKDYDKLGYVEVKNPRPDPQVTLLEWSPDSNKMLLFYSFTDDNYKLQSGTAIYDVNKDRFLSINPYPEETDEGVEPRKPEGFKWN